MGEKYLIVSLGSIGSRHLENLRELKPSAEIGVLHLLRRAESPRVCSSKQVFFNLDDALNFHPSAAIICSPASTHLEVAIKLVLHRIPMFIEKPIANDSHGLIDLINLSHQLDVPIMVGYNLRFMPSLVEARRLIAEGVVGRIKGVRCEVGQYLPDWRPNSDYRKAVSASSALGGGVLLELSHEIDYLCWIFGTPASVTAVGGRYGELEINTEDMASLLLEYHSPPCLVQIHLDALQRFATRTCKFIGSDGTLIWNGIEETIDLYRAEEARWRRLTLPRSQDKNRTYLDALAHFFDVVDGRATLNIDAEQGLRVLHVVEAAKRSIALRTAVDLT